MSLNSPTDTLTRSASDIQTAFEQDKVWDASPDDLRFYLQTLNTQRISNISVQHRAIIQALTINHIQLTRMIGDLEKRNGNTQFWFMFLAIGSLIVGALAIFL